MTHPSWESQSPRSPHCSFGVLTAIDILAVPILASQAAGLVTQGYQLCRRKLRLVLEVAKFAVLAMAAYMPVVAHLLAGALHALVKGGSSVAVACRQGLVKSLLFFVVIGIFLVLWFRSRRDRDVAIGCNTSLTDIS